MIFGYILSEVEGQPIQSQFYGIADFPQIEMVSGGLSALFLFSMDVLKEPLEELITAHYTMTVSLADKILLTLITQRPAGIVKSITRRFATIIMKALPADIPKELGELRTMIAPQLEQLEQEIDRINKEARHAPYVSKGE